MNYREEDVFDRVAGDDGFIERHTDIFDFYEIERISQSVQEGGYQKVALQFPDSLVRDAVDVVDALVSRCGSGVTFFVLADTSYGECCVDEVAASHYSAEFIVHFGRSCLSPTNRIPVMLVFGKAPIDVGVLVDSFVSQFDEDAVVTVFYDVMYWYIIDQFREEVLKVRKNVYFTDILNESENREFHFCGRSMEHEIVENSDLFYIGTYSPILVNLIMRYNDHTTFSYNPETSEIVEESVGVNKKLFSRYFMIEKTKDADIIGIIVCTLGVANYLESLEYIKQVINNAGKKFYMFVVGKLNEVKLASFMEIDVYVIIACPEATLIDSHDYYRPIVTPFELEIALVKGKEWNTEYLTDFNTILKNSGKLEINDEESSEEEYRVSLITGGVTRNPKAVSSISLEENPNALVERSEMKLAKTTASTKFLELSFKGLEQKLGETPVGAAVPGLSGIPFLGYGMVDDNEQKSEEKSD
eukprot:TRINITY_DN6977_c0_g1_i1.p1 TRINITY_DN6977_c0_g1~~TRINITY_DN6977_c0_g1_i1.p1  ORF type:complete len:472 (-),score=112.21 TRINITY_DN6977_c0_g1_i1:411-1826(-)